jgi:hypothetical protein
MNHPGARQDSDLPIADAGPLQALLLGARQRLADPPRFIEPDLGCLLILALNRFVDLAAMHRNLSWRFDTEPDFVAANIDDGYNDIITDDDAFVALSR